MTKRIDVGAVPAKVGTLYPDPYHLPCLARSKQALGDAAGLTQFGVNLLTLEPGVWSAQRHWHEREDEFVYVLSGEVVLVTDDGEEVLRTGDAAGFKAGEPNGHHLINRSNNPATVLEVGTRTTDDVAHYPEADLVAISHKDGFSYTHKDGMPYQNIWRRGPAAD